MTRQVIHLYNGVRPRSNDLRKLGFGVHEFSVTSENGQSADRPDAK